MIKQFLKIAGVKTEKDLLRKYGSEQEFFADHPEAEMLAYAAMGGSFYQNGGSSLRNFMNTVEYTPRRYNDGGMASQPDPEAAMVQQGPPPPDQGQGQLEEVIKMIVQALQQGMAPEQIMAKLVEMGIPEDQAGELVQGVVQQLQAQSGAEGQQPSQEQMMAGPQGQEAPPEEMMEEEAPMGRYGGMYRGGGEPCPGRNQIRNEQGTCVCGPGFVTDDMSGECIPIGLNEEPGNSMINSMPRSLMNTRGFNAGIGLKGKKYNFNYGFNVAPDFKTGVEHNATLGIPNLFTMGKNRGGLDLNADYKVSRSFGAGLDATLPLTKRENGSLLKFTGNVDKMFNDPELRNSTEFNMMESPKKNPMNYQAGVEYSGRMFGSKGPEVTIGANYGNREYGGLSKFIDGGAPQQGGQDQQQQIMQQVAQALQQGAQPEEVMQQLVQMGIPQDQAQQLIQMIMQQMQGASEQQAPMQMYGGSYKYGGYYGNVPQHGNPGTYADGYSGTSNGGQYFDYGGPYIPLYNGGGDNNYSIGGKVKKYKKGGEYDMTNQEVEDLIKQGYKIQYI
jgi:hypothetical protein